MARWMLCFVVVLALAGCTEPDDEPQPDEPAFDTDFDGFLWRGILVGVAIVVVAYAIYLLAHNLGEKED